MRAAERLIVALDQPTGDAALRQVDALGDAVERYKIGLELYLAEGRQIVDAINARKKRVFLDLKLHDIPETVKRATERVVGLGVDLMTIHAGGGEAMMRAAVEVARPAGAKVLAVTVLTSLDDKDLAADGHGEMSVEELVVRRALLAQVAGCAGVIASPKEIAAIRRVVGPDFLIVTPGVRPASHAGGDDQKRVATAKKARHDGADAVVVGRPIRDAADMRAAARGMIEELT